MGNQRKHRQNHQRRPSITLSSVFVAAIIVVLLGAVSAVFGLGSAAFTGKFGSLQITTTSVGLVLVIVGLIFLYRMARLIPPDDFHLRIMVRDMRVPQTTRLARNLDVTRQHLQENSEIPKDTNPPIK